MGYKKFLLVFVLSVFILQFASALVIEDITFHSSVSNYTISVDDMTLDQIIVTNITIEFYNITSTSSRLTNINATHDARADLYGLLTGTIITNLNTNTILFNATSSSNNNVNITFSPGHVISLSSPVPSNANNACTAMLIEFGLFPALIGLLGVIILLGVVITILVGGFGTISLSGISREMLVGGILILISLGVLVIMAIVIMGSMCVLL